MDERKKEHGCVGGPDGDRAQNGFLANMSIPVTPRAIGSYAALGGKKSDLWGPLNCETKPIKLFRINGYY